VKSYFCNHRLSFQSIIFCLLFVCLYSCNRGFISKDNSLPPVHTRTSEVVLKPHAEKGVDAIILSKEADKNFGALENLNINTSLAGADTAFQRMLISFGLDSFPDYAHVLKATLVLFRDSTSENPNPMHYGKNAYTTYRVVEPWEEEKVNWDNQPAFEVGGSVWNRKSWSEQQGSFEVDVTHMVRQMINKRTDNYGFLLKFSEEVTDQNISWVSSDHRDTSLHPELRIEFRGAVHRKINTISSIEVTQEVIYVEVWDHNKIDDDTISLFLNDEKILENFRISGRKAKFPITLKPGYNRLILHAENLGSIPPNTAALRIIEPGKSHPFQLKSDLDASEAVNIVYRTKKYRPDLE